MRRKLGWAGWIDDADVTVFTKILLLISIPGVHVFYIIHGFQYTDGISTYNTLSQCLIIP